MRLKGKLALVTGGSRDIGREVSLQLAREGAAVVINYLNSEEDATQTKKMIEDAGGRCLLVKGDMTKSTDANALVEQAQAAFGKEIHILVNVAGGLFGRKTIEIKNLQA